MQALGITGPSRRNRSLAAMTCQFRNQFLWPSWLLIQADCSTSTCESKSRWYSSSTSLPLEDLWDCLFEEAYSASKGALGIATEALRMEVKSQNINLVTLAPGDYATDIASRRHPFTIK